jgi:hypothetical protein
MSAGVLIFALNNEQIDYVSLAEWSAKNIQRHLGLPTKIITQNDVETNNTRYFDDVGTVTWHNQTRMDAYKLSPWEQTLVLDADYVVASDQLKIVLNCQQNFMCHRWAYDVTGMQTFDDLNYFGRYRMPMWWATVMMFRRSRQAEIIFESMRMIKDNWSHYRNLYANSRSTYRNDHALSIALNIENGHTLQTTDIPWNLATVVPGHKVSCVATDHYRIDFTTPDGKSKWITLQQDFHAMGKKCLGEIVANTA